MNTKSTPRTVALVTGANKGIGLEIARQLGRRGITVLVGARDTDRGETAARTLRDERIDASFLQLDVTDRTSVEAAALPAKEGLSKICSAWGHA